MQTAGISFGVKWKAKARVCTSQAYVRRDRGYRTKWNVVKRLTELLDIFEDALFSDVTLSILIVIYHLGKNPSILTSMQQTGLAKFLQNVDNFLRTTRRHINKTCPVFTGSAIKTARLAN
jgi:hypothetical protein